MAIKFYKWLAAIFMVCTLTGFNAHPIFVSVTEIEYNAGEKSLEVSCKLFTDDFEKTLRSIYQTRVDLLKPADKNAMERLVNDYVQKHLKISVNGLPVAMKFVGYEQIEEGIFCYFESANVNNVHTLDFTNDLLYEYNNQQMGIVHVTVNGQRKSTKLNFPEKTGSVRF